MPVFQDHIGTDILKKEEVLPEKEVAYSYKAEISVTIPLNAEAASPLAVVFKSYICDSKVCFCLETQSSFKAAADAQEILNGLNKAETKQECARLLALAQAEHLKALVTELRSKKMSILCAEYQPPSYFERLIESNKVKFSIASSLIPALIMVLSY